MSTPFVAFPNTSTDYVFTNNVNVLGADTAHMAQALTWLLGSGSSAIVLDSSGTPASVFGPNTVKMTTSGATALLTTATAPTGLTGAYILSVWVYTDVADREAFLRFDGSYGSSAGGALTPGAWTQIKVSKTTPTTGAIEVNYRVASTNANPPASEVAFVSAACLRAGTDPAFVSALDVDSTLFEEKSESGLTATLASGVLKVGVSFDGDGYYYRRYDGADNTAPLVAEFLASDVLAAL